MADDDSGGESEGRMSDIVLNSNGDIDVTDYTSPRLFVEGEELQAIAQHLTIRLRMFRGEWFLDVNQGVPYFQDILGKKGIGNVASILLKRVVEQTPGVVRVEDLNVDFNDRMLTVSFRAVCDAGLLNFRLDLRQTTGRRYNDPTISYSSSAVTYEG